MTDLVLPDWDGTNAKGRETRELVLKTALSILVEEGSQAMSMRRVAAECGMQFGNLTYHYPTKEDLITELLEAVIRGYEVQGAPLMATHADGLEARLTEILRFALDDIRTKKTTRLFPELWALANRDDFTHRRLHALYRRARAPLEEAIAEARPDLPPEARTRKALRALHAHVRAVGRQDLCGHGAEHQRSRGAAVGRTAQPC